MHLAFIIFIFSLPSSKLQLKFAQFFLFSFNRINTFHWYKERTYLLEHAYDPANRITAFERSLEWGDQIPLGLFYRKERPVMEDRYPMLTEQCLAAMRLDHKNVVDREMECFF